MERTGISETTLRHMAAFYLKELFYGIPEIPVTYGNPEKGEISHDAAGEFCLKKNRDYGEESDELFNTPGYEWRYRTLWEGFPEFGGIDEGGYQDSWEHPLNHPEVRIVIRRDRSKNALLLTGTLLHELLHYYCWYTGLDHHDGDKDFEGKCREMGLSSNFRDWKWENGEWKRHFDYSRVEEYLRMYISHISDQNAGKETAA